MKRNCNLELRLFPTSNDFEFCNVQEQEQVEEQQQQQQQQMTIFYNGRVCTCDVTEFQAKTILSLAGGETEGKSTINNSSPRSGSPSSSAASPTPTTTNQSQVYTPASTGLSMKRSLQRFLQKRKTRIEATSSPYYNFNNNRRVQQGRTILKSTLMC